MGLGASWTDTYLEHQQKKQYYVMFINKSPIIYQNVSSDFFHMVLGTPWSDAYLEPQKTIHDVYKSIYNNPPNIVQELTQWSLVPLWVILI